MKTYEWDDVIDFDDSEIDPRNLETIILPAGVYPFTVLKVERDHFDGSGKIPPCNMAKIHLWIDRKGLCSEVFFVTRSMEWKAAAFLACIGKRRHGDPLVWKDLLQCKGLSGQCEIIVDKYIDKKGKVWVCNKVKQYIEKKGGQENGQSESNP